MTIIWKDDYLIGDAEVDAQHQHLFKLANQFLAASDKATLTLCAMQLYQHTRAHFTHEENLMRQVNFPECQAHIDWHNHMISRLNSISQSIADDTLNKQDLEILMTDWALRHIPHDDARLATHIAGDGAA